MRTKQSDETRRDSPWRSHFLLSLSFAAGLVALPLVFSTSIVPGGLQAYERTMRSKLVSAIFISSTMTETLTDIAVCCSPPPLSFEY